MAEVKPEVETFARIKVVGVGGSGSNAITRMIECKLSGVEFVAVNADAQDLHACGAKEKIHIGKNLTKGLGTGMNPELGRQAAEENRDEIHEALKSCDMVFVVYGAGGGTGSGAGPVVAEAAREAGALTVGVITKPFSFEGKQRAAIADESLENLKDRVDTLITIQNDKLLQIIDRQTSLLNAFRIVDDVLRQGVQGISDLITKPGIVNVDFADIKSVMQDSGSALMGVGVVAGENRAQQAAKEAVNSPLLDVSVEGARGILFNVTGGTDLTMMEVNEAANLITENVDPNARIIFGAACDETVKKGEIKITVVATGFDGEGVQQEGFLEQIQSANFGEESQKEEEEQNFYSDFGSIQRRQGHSEGKEEEESGGKAGFTKKEIEKEDGGDEDQKNDFVDKSPLEDSDDDLEIPAFIRKKMGK
ncbi:MAG: cell division protein FtsZ [Candidatus Moranbacteria bacterium]|nr:cell division protein FtsZ [Candidatus Moranbacteria bacterium]